MRNRLASSKRLPVKMHLLKAVEIIPQKQNDGENVVNVRSPAIEGDPWWMATHTERTREENCGYSVPRLKDLPKLHKAVWKDDLQRVKTVLMGLKKQMYIDYFDKDHRTALHFACARGHDGMVKVICGNGANPNIADGHGKTALHKAVESGNYSSVQHLLNIRADVDVIDDMGRTPLHLAAKMGDIPAVQLLLERGARTDIQEEDGLTAEHVATLNSNLEIVQLISRAAKESERDTDSDMVIIDEEEDYELISSQLSACEVGRVTSTPLSQKATAASSQSSGSSDFELIFDDTDDDCSIVNVSHYEDLLSDCFSSASSSSSSSSSSESSASEQTSSESEDSSDGWDSESVVSEITQNTCEFCAEVSDSFSTDLPPAIILSERSWPEIRETVFTANRQSARLRVEESISEDSEETIAANDLSSVGTGQTESTLSASGSRLSVLEDSGPDIIVVTDSEEEDEPLSLQVLIDEEEELLSLRALIEEEPLSLQALIGEEEPLSLHTTTVEEEIVSSEPISNGCSCEPEEGVRQLSEEDELLRKQMALLDSFQMLVAEAQVINKEHELPSLKERCPMYSFHEPVMLKFSDLAIHFLNDPNRVPVGENLIGLAGKIAALAWVSPEEMVEADPTDPHSLKVLISRTPLMQIIGLGVLQWIDFDDHHVFITSPDVQTSSNAQKVNTIVFGTPEYPQVHHCWPPAAEKEEIETETPEEQNLEDSKTEQRRSTEDDSDVKEVQSLYNKRSGKPSPIIQQALLNNNSSSSPHQTRVNQNTLPHPAQAHCMQPTLSHTTHGTLPFSMPTGPQQSKLQHSMQNTPPFSNQSTLPSLMNTLPHATLPSLMMLTPKPTPAPPCTQATLTPHMVQTTLPAHPNLAPPVQQLMAAYATLGGIPPPTQLPPQMNTYAVQAYQARPTGIAPPQAYTQYPSLNYLQMLQLSQNRQYTSSHPPAPRPLQHKPTNTHTLQNNPRNSPNAAAFNNQLLHMLSKQQAPGTGQRFRPQEWFTSI